MATSDESELWARLRAGDDAAWTVFFDTHSPRVWTYVARVIGTDRHAIADVVQEVFMGAAKAVAAFDPQQGTFIRWLLGIAHRQTALYWRRCRRGPLTLELSVFSSVISSDDADAQVLLENTERAEAVRIMLAALPEDMATLLIGRYLDDRSTAELADEFNVTEDAIRSRLVRARDRFREQFSLLHQEFV